MEKHRAEQPTGPAKNRKAPANWHGGRGWGGVHCSFGKIFSLLPPLGPGKPGPLCCAGLTAQTAIHACKWLVHFPLPHIAWRGSHTKLFQPGLQGSVWPA